MNGSLARLGIVVASGCACVITFSLVLMIDRPAHVAAYIAAVAGIILSIGLFIMCWPYRNGEVKIHFWRSDGD